MECVSSHDPSSPDALFSPCVFFFFNDTATTEIYTLSLHDALPISDAATRRRDDSAQGLPRSSPRGSKRSEERFSRNAETALVCRLLLEKKRKAVQDRVDMRPAQGDPVHYAIGRPA